MNVENHLSKLNQFSHLFLPSVNILVNILLHMITFTIHSNWQGVWNYMLPGMKSSGVFRDGRVTSVELLDSMGFIVAGFSNGGLHFTLTLKFY